MKMFDSTLCGNPAEPHTNKGQSDLPVLSNKPLAVNEIYGPTFQGEGKSLGKEVMFLRTAGCNLACVWCDTPFTWNWKGTKFAHPDKFDPKVEVHKMETNEVIAKLQELGPQVRALVISGGEPMLQQKRLLELLQTLKQDNYWVEVETNGTIVPDDNFVELIDQINCSPKLANSGPDNPLSKREVAEALKKLASIDKTTFKFVVTDINDLPEILRLVTTYSMKNVYLMPEGRTPEEQLAKQSEIQRICENFGFNYTPRLHILTYGAKRGV